MRTGCRVVVAVLVVLGAVGPIAGAVEPPSAVDDGDQTIPQRDDPDGDPIGWENGYWHDERIDVDQSDGLSDAEMDAFVGRAMARVEYIREAEFDADVPVEVVPRSEFQRSRGNGSGDAADDAWNDQVWEALFVVGENRSANEVLRSTAGESVAGFYAPGDDRIRIITDSPGSPTIDNGTLVHELVHALQDQRGHLGGTIATTATQDGELAADGLVEGEANYVERRYAQRCGVEWECVATPPSGASGSATNLGILLTLLQPYSDGPVYVDWLLDRGGWDAVDAAFADPPTSSEQIIHLTDDPPTPIAFEDGARNGWETFPNQGENGSDTVGEASMYVMFWYQARTVEADTVSVGSIGRTAGPMDLYNYDAEPSAGWGDDRLFPYRRTAGNETRYGYVWVTEWDSRADATQFVAAYRAILDAHDATRREDGTYVVPSGEFADAFRLDRDGTRVTIVNGPTPAAVDDIRPSADSVGSGGGERDGGISWGEAPGFGALAGVVAVLLGAALVAARRRD